MSKKRIRTVAIDGPSGSGKTTVAKALANELSKKHGLEIKRLDTGAMYRAVALAALRKEIALDKESEISKMAKGLKIHIKGEKTLLDGDDVSKEIREPETTKAASHVAQYVEVRRHLRKLQHKWVRSNHGGILEGRDIGTVVLPNADIKIYLTADPDTRAERRAREYETEHKRSTSEVLESMQERDKTDQTRKHAPLQKAEDALEISTSGREVAQVVAEILEKVDEKIAADLLEGIKIVKPHSLRSYILYKTIRVGAFVLFRVYFRGKVVGRKKLFGLKKGGAFILAPAGHRSNLDTPIVGATFPGVIRYMAKDSLFLRSRFWNKFLASVGAFPVKRDGLDVKAMRTAMEVLTRKEGILLFPEGARQVGPEVLPLFAGVVWLAIRTGAKIIPVGLAGGEEAMPIGKKIPLPKKIALVIGDPISFEPTKMSRPEIQEHTEKLRDTLQDLYDRAKAEAK